MTIYWKHLYTEETDTWAIFPNATACTGLTESETNGYTINFSA